MKVEIEVRGGGGGFEAFDGPPEGVADAMAVLLDLRRWLMAALVPLGAYLVLTPVGAGWFLLADTGFGAAERWIVGIAMALGFVMLLGLAWPMARQVMAIGALRERPSRARLQQVLRAQRDFWWYVAVLAALYLLFSIPNTLAMLALGFGGLGL